ncbi:Early light-induced protein [Hibiscus syriacus]|uniref:Early light-induced protein n=1 Tax=Hibiscus syriacus TaxID=106335 RepID=A0A6A2XAZ1_HIBSY|nr:Early light-induced protein [Hibiscus syriacus]
MCCIHKPVHFHHQPTHPCRLFHALNSLFPPMFRLPRPAREAQKASTRSSDVFAFSGTAPERINGRLAMVGFVAALAVELTKGQDVFTQLSDGGIPLFVGTGIFDSVVSSGNGGVKIR